MVIFLYLAVMVSAMYWVVKILGPEMVKPPEVQVTRKTRAFELIPDNNEQAERIEKLESLLAEKNSNISLLQKELRVFYAQIREFDKVKSLLEEEILHLRDQNRIFRSELGLPAAQLKEHSIK